MKQTIKQESNFVIPQTSFIERIEQFPQKELFGFQKENNSPIFLTGEILIHKIKNIGNALQQELAPQGKALLLFNQGLEFICSLMACFYANVIAIPIPISDSSHKEQVVEKINSILNDSQATCIITDSYYRAFLETEQFDNSVSVLNINELDQDSFFPQKEREKVLEDIAVLLYTSGSISKPKGVMLSYQNLISQAYLGTVQWEISQDSRIVSWMPQFHSFGLVFNILAPLLKGAKSLILSPNSFIENPETWMNIIDKNKSTHTAAPNFAFDYCCSTIDINDIKEISLSSLKVIVCGGEAVRKETYKTFINKFRNLGIEKNVFCPHYGLSETGTITTKKPGQPLRFLSLDIPSLELGKIKHTNQSNKSKSITSCGEIGIGVKVLIVNPETGKLCAPDEVGEIWVQSGSVGRGYYQQEEETQKTFVGVLNDTNESGFLRTGDLGFIEDNHLYVIGREKEVIIIHGKNHHPVDIEWTIKKHFPMFTLPMTVFSIEVNNDEKVIVVLEFETPLNESTFNKLAHKILRIVSENHALEIHELIFIKKGGIPRTGSGKIQKKACRNSYLNQELPILYQYRNGVSGIHCQAQELSLDVNQEIITTLKKEVFLPVLNQNLSKLEEISLFSELGLNSIHYLRLSKQIEKVYQIQFTPIMLFKYSSFEKLAEFISTQIKLSTIKIATPLQIEDEKISNHQNVCDMDIAIIGMSGRFPGAKDLKIFWLNLVQQKDCITTITEGRPQIVKDFINNYSNISDSYPQWGGFIEDIETFDAPFFGISPLEAESMDPQQRKLLELTWSVIENSGYNPSQLAGQTVGLFIGIHNNDFAELVSRQPRLIKTYGAYLDSGLHLSMIAHRVSRWFDFHGPSEIINTACSSSLVAIHHAVESIYRGESTLAIAGGINIILTSRIYCASDKAGMLSKDGRCKTFDQTADGFVRSEGYGALLLKPLSQAIKDKDTIYGIIKCAVINHDGHSNSLRAPNLNAQKQLIKSAFKKTGFSPETISYIETHGTGTSLGDPIEFQALQEAFKEINPEISEAFCGLGSVKTNIGHCESAAGIASLIKVLLSMKYRMLPSVLHFKNINPFISLEKSPFYIVSNNQEWERFTLDGQEIPRRAGISSFGFGGANAHIIIEEYISKDTEQKLNDSNTLKTIIPISAKNKERLYDYIEQFYTFLNYLLMEEDLNNNFGNINLRNLAYTLQVGREAMEERIVFLVKEIPELIEKLKAYLQRKEDITDCWCGRNTKTKEVTNFMEHNEDSKELINKWNEKGKFDKIAQYWVNGGVIDWDKFYGKTKPERVGLPTYPFAKSKYWIPEIEENMVKKLVGINIGAIHPLLQQNTSDLMEQRYTTTLNGQEFFLENHKIIGQSVLPAAAYLEMARCAVEKATGKLNQGQQTIKLKNVVWVRPLVVDKETVKLHIKLCPEKSEEIFFEIFCDAEGEDSDFIIYSQGSAELNETKDIPILDIQTTKSESKFFQESSDKIYQVFEKFGMEYGPGHRGIEEIYISPGQVLSKLKLPAILLDTINDYVLHPAILDSTLQASIGLMMDTRGFNDKKLKPILPYALDEIEIFRKYQEVMWVLIQYSDGNKLGDQVQKIDIDVCDEYGMVCSRIRGLMMRMLDFEKGIKGRPINIGTLLLQPIWREKEINESIIPEYEKQLVVLCEVDKINKSIINNLEVHSLIFKYEPESIAKRYQRYSMQLFEEVKKIMLNKPKGKILIQVVIPLKKEQQLFWGLSGLLKTMQKENPALIGQVIGIDEENDVNDIVRILNENCLCQEDTKIYYQKKERYVEGWNEISINENIENNPWKETGVYLITGGTGGLGKILAQEIVKKAKNAVIILTGRSQFDEDKKSIINLISKDSRIEYKQLNVTNQNEVEKLLKDIYEEYGKLNGIIHCAGIIKDNYIIKKSIEEFGEVLEPKVKGLVNIDEASKNMDLDIFILFSSISGVMGNPGQSDYSLANAFMDMYAHYRNELVQKKERYGRTISINWPLWTEGGMRIDMETEKMIRENTGMVALNTQKGIQVFYQAIFSGKDQLMVLEGDIDQIKQTLNLSSTDYIKSNGIMKLESDFYLNLIQKISIGEISEEQLIKIVKS